MFACGSSHLFLSAAKGNISDDYARLQAVYSRLSLEDVSLTFFSVVFGSTLGLWTIQSTVAGHPFSTGHGDSLKVKQTLVNYSYSVVLPLPSYTRMYCWRQNVM